MLDIISVSGVGAAVIRWYHRDTAEHAHFSEASSSLRRFEKLSIFLGTIVKPGVITAVVAKSFIIIEIACDDDIRRTVWWYSVLYCTVLYPLMIMASLIATFFSLDRRRA